MSLERMRRNLLTASYRFSNLKTSRRRRSLPAVDNPERGDVPGWVMITLMSAVLVAALLALAGPALEGLFNQAMDTVAK
jgi:type VI protein secretion system component VasF